MTKILLKNIFVIIRARVSFITVGYVTDTYYYNSLIKLPMYRQLQDNDISVIKDNAFNNLPSLFLL